MAFPVLFGCDVIAAFSRLPLGSTVEGSARDALWKPGRGLSKREKRATDLTTFRVSRFDVARPLSIRVFAPSCPS